MSTWHHLLREVEVLAEVEMARALQHVPLPPSHQVRKRPITFFTPAFRHYYSEELPAAAAHWPALSITGAECRLQCDHCKGGVLSSMVPVTTPALLHEHVARLAAQGAGGFLLTGGSNRHNEVEYGPYWDTLAAVRAEYPHLQIACHTALMDADAVTCMEQAGVDIAMLDVIGARDTIQQVYHLKREVDDFEETLALLVASGMRVVPHIVMGLHYGYFLGEWQALEIVARWQPDALVLVAAMPTFAGQRRPFRIPDTGLIGRFFHDARRRLGDIPLLLGCARPPGLARQRIDALAVMAGLDGIAHPADGVVELAARAQRPVRVADACCSTLIADGAVGETLDLATILACRDAQSSPGYTEVRVPLPRRASGAA